MQVYTCTLAFHQSRLDVFLDCPRPLFFESVSLTQPGAHQLVRLAEQWAPMIGSADDGLPELRSSGLARKGFTG